MSVLSKRQQNLTIKPDHNNDITTLPIRQQAFIAKVVEDWPEVNWSAAAQYVGYSKRTSRTFGHQLSVQLKRFIDPRIEARRHLLASRAQKSKEEWLIEIQRCAFFDVRKMFDALGNPKEITELDDDSAAAIAGFKFTEEYIGKKNSEEKTACGYTKEFKLTNKLAALELFGKATGYYVEKSELRVGVLDDVSLQELRAMREQIRARLDSNVIDVTP